MKLVEKGNLVVKLIPAIQEEILPKWKEHFKKLKMFGNSPEIIENLSEEIINGQLWVDSRAD